MLCTLLLVGGVTITLAEKAEVKGLEISVAEVATVTTEDPADMTRVLNASLGYAPAPGYHRVLRADLVLFDLKRALPELRIEVRGADRCRVDPMIEVLDVERLWGLGSADLEELFRGTDASIKREGELAPIEVPQGETPLVLRTSLTSRTTDAGPKNVAVQLWVDGDLYRTVHLPFMVALREPRWVLKRPVAEGEVLSPSLFELKRVEVTGSASQHGLPVEALAGTVAARPLPASAVVTERDIQRPLVVRRNDLVTVLIRSGALEARDLGVATADARVGEAVRVKLQSNNREIVGRVVAAGLIEIVLR
jgi:flagella basal body P-ring formation protein FlgA